jgi:hypothetical protein
MGRVELLDGRDPWVRQLHRHHLGRVLVTGTRASDDEVSNFAEPRAIAASVTAAIAI